MKIIKLSDDVSVVFSFRAIVLFEKITDKPFELRQAGGRPFIEDLTLYMYCCYHAANPDNTATLEEFFDKVDDNPALLPAFIDAYLRHSQVEQQFNKESDNSVKTKKNKRSAR